MQEVWEISPLWQREHMKLWHWLLLCVQVGPAASYASCSDIDAHAGLLLSRQLLAPSWRKRMVCSRDWQWLHGCVAPADPRHAMPAQLFVVVGIIVWAAMLVCSKAHAMLQVFQLVSAKLEVDWTAADGKHVSKGTKFGTVRGPAVPLLTAERVALNFLQRMSGIATATARMQAEVQVSRRL